jgi:hypothetical protein
MNHYAVAYGQCACGGPDPCPDSDSLDAAWAEAEAALPKGWDGPTVGPFVDNLRHVDRWVATAGKYIDNLDLPKEERGFGPTPAAALRALAAKLRGV